MNLSHNSLSGHLPSLLGNIAVLESLDLSSNQLTGKIPGELTRLTFLAVLNFSKNHLVGPIPHGNQFDTFQNDSYVGNSGLCGLPLSKKCGDSEVPPQPISPDDDDDDDDDDDFASGFTWRIMLMGYGCGLVIGVTMGLVMFLTGRLVRNVLDSCGLDDFDTPTDVCQPPLYSCEIDESQPVPDSCRLHDEVTSSKYNSGSTLVSNTLSGKSLRQEEDESFKNFLDNILDYSNKHALAMLDELTKERDSNRNNLTKKIECLKKQMEIEKESNNDALVMIDELRKEKDSFKNDMSKKIECLENEKKQMEKLKMQEDNDKVLQHIQISRLQH
ncbi:hypothetical protein RHMOL_Rhmol09G0068700 [Rhododendron molle]|uniref:Uncharacterized protein n=1 Tax=Rhododendron molle TaxID=49168 RepID=A0ACC0MBU7_RHOML|nr:hypothetical protein RHMOL_Rhmol09G0068700 [Rhododendron molle]